jgi:hypothetical protein
LSVTEACRKLGISRQRFYTLEERAVDGFLRALAPMPSGRPPKPADPAAPLLKKIGLLERENRKLWLYVQWLRKLAGIEEGGSEQA